MSSASIQKRVVVTGTIYPSDYDPGWVDSSVVIVTENGEEYVVMSDEVGDELGDHVYEEVTARGVLRGIDTDRFVFEVWRFDVVSPGGAVAFDADTDLDRHGYSLDQVLVDDDDDESEWIDS